MAGGGQVKLGLTVRNLTEPSFDGHGHIGCSLRLERQARAGVAVSFAGRDGPSQPISI